MRTPCNMKVMWEKVWASMGHAAADLELGNCFNAIAGLRRSAVRSIPSQLPGPPEMHACISPTCTAAVKSANSNRFITVIEVVG